VMTEGALERPKSSCTIPPTRGDSAFEGKRSGRGHPPMYTFSKSDPWAGEATGGIAVGVTLSMWASQPPEPTGSSFWIPALGAVSDGS
jgi:hypothetical protein